MKSIVEIAAAIFEAWQAESMKQGMSCHLAAFKELDPKLQACWVAAVNSARKEMEIL